MGSISPERRYNINSICIIGAGPSGLAAAKYLLAENAFSSIRIFEQRATAGGLWNYTTCPEHTTNDQAVPQTSPHGDHDQPIRFRERAKEASLERSESEPVFLSPLYDKLETNIPRGLMGFSDLEWPDDCQLFPNHETVLEYLERYADDVRHLIQFKTQVVDVTPETDGRWLVTTRRISEGIGDEPEIQVYDAVVVASGHFNVPFIPSVPGIRAWDEAYPGTVSHSMFYRRPEDYTHKKVVVVGNSASGVDIGGQIAAVCKLPLLQSQKSESFLQPDKTSTKAEKPEIVEYIPDGRQVRFSDGSVERDVDEVLYCTGYFYSFPFLKSLEPPMISTGDYVEHTYLHVFYWPRPTLALVALNQKIIPFPIAEAQCAVISRVWSGRLSLPSESEMQDWEQTTFEETGGGRNFHVLKFPKDADYIDMMHDWALTADRKPGVSNELHKRRMSSSAPNRPRATTASHERIGKEPPYWGEKEYWTRERFPAIKKAYQSFGEGRQSKRTLEDVGFSFEAWKEEKIEEARQLL